MTVDGVGEWTTTTLGVGKSALGSQDEAAPSIELFEEQRFPHSLGLLYSTFTAWLGFRVNNGEYKVMGMSSYGEPRYQDKIGQAAHPRSIQRRLPPGYVLFRLLSLDNAQLQRQIPAALR